MADIPNALNALFKNAESAIAGILAKTHFVFDVAGQSKDTFKVIHWEGKEGISSPYKYTLNLATQGAIDEAEVLGKAATLSIDWEGETRLIHGYVSTLSHIGALVSDHAEEYLIVIESAMARLELNRQSRIFLNLDVKAVLEQILLSAGFSADSFKFDLKSTYAIREYTVQYNESDFNFFTRQLEHAGLFYNFVHQQEQALLVIQDVSAGLPRMAGTASLTYLPATGQVEGEESVQLLRKVNAYLTQSVKRKDYNYRTPETTLLNSTTTLSSVPSIGNDYVYGERLVTLEEGEQLVRHRQEALDWQRAVYTAESNCRGIVAGTTFSISAHPNDDCNGDFLVLTALHQGDQSRAFAFGGSSTESATTKTYHNELTLIKKEVAYRTPVDLTRRPVVAGVVSAKIETTGGDYAYLDDQGRYRLKSLFDTAETKEGEASHAVRMMQVSAGSNYGVHFPLHAGTEVMIICMHGDPDRPIIMGGLSNPATRSPVTSANASEHIIRTFAGNELLMDDLEKSEKINLHTKDKKNILTLDANSDSHKVSLRTEEGLAEFYAKKTMSFESGDSYSLISGKDQTITVENRHTLQTNKKEIAFNAGTDITFTAKQNIKLNTETQDIKLSSGKDLIIESGKGLSIRVIDGDNSISIEQGSLSIEAAKAITLLSLEGPISIEQGGGKVELKDGKLSVTGNKVSIEGSSVAIKGQMAELGGSGGGGGAAAKKAKAAAPVAATASTQAAPVTMAKADAKPVAATSTSTSTPASNSTSENNKLFDDKFKLLHGATGLPMSQTEYVIKRATGSIEHGTTDDEGRTHLLSSIAKAESIEIFI
jgi:type VI secretion system secreted protein VgrG